MPRQRPYNRLQRLTLCALFSALLCVLSPIAIPIGPIPLSLGLLGVFVCAVALPPAMALASVASFLALGLFGLPLFAMGTGGAVALLSPTGGYLWSYLLVAPLVSYAARRAQSVWQLTLACAVALPLCYLCGTLQYCLITQVSPRIALSVTVLPCLPFDLIKTLAAAYVGKLIRTHFGA
ncbi:MAG: biotin transporter BioY [Ruminococcaceae bacterium]|nr:biotin transporter BioY [Oscillospiraceae bacterium]